MEKFNATIFLATDLWNRVFPMVMVAQILLVCTIGFFLIRRKYKQISPHLDGFKFVYVLWAVAPVLFTKIAPHHQSFATPLQGGFSPSHMFRLSGFIFVGLALFIAVYTRGFNLRRWSLAGALFFAYLLFAALTAPLFPELLWTWYKAFEFIVVILFAACIAFSMKGENQSKYLLDFTINYYIIFVIAMLSGLIITGGAVFDTFSTAPGIGEIRRLGGLWPMANPEMIGNLSVIVFLDRIVRIFLEPRKRNYINYSILSLSFIIMTLARSRGSILGWMISLLIFFIVIKKKRIVFLIGLLGGLFFLLFPNFTTDSVETLVTYSARGDVDEQFEKMSGRHLIWEKTIEIWKASPWVGHGMHTGLRRKLSITDLEGNTHAHNSTLQLLAGTGIIGAFFALSSFVLLLVGLYPKRKRWRNQRLEAMRFWLINVFILTVSLVYVPYTAMDVYAFTLVPSLFFLVQGKKEQSKKNQSLDENILKRLERRQREDAPWDNEQITENSPPPPPIILPPKR